MTGSPDVIVWGAGAIGGKLAAVPARAGVNVCVVDVARDHLERVAAHGLTVEGPLGGFTARMAAATPDTFPTGAPFVFLAVKSQDTADACRRLRPGLLDSSAVTLLQN